MTIAHRLYTLLLLLCFGALAACSGPVTDLPESDPAPTSEAVTADAAPGTAAPHTDTAQQTASGDASARGTAAPVPEKAEGEATAQETGAPAPDEPVGAPLPDGVVTALLIGTDSRDGDLGGMSDVIVLVQLSEDRDHLNLVSIARDSYVDIPGYGRDKINAAFARGGIPLLRETVSELMGGLEVDLVAQTNFEMFVALTRWMDGFWVDNQHATAVTVGSTGRQVVFQEGRVKLENTDGLIYVRERKNLPLGDLDRTERHRAALVGMMERLVEIREQQPEKLPELLPMLFQNVKIDGDLQLEQLMTMVDVGAELGPDGITSLMVPVSSFGWSDAGASVNLLDEGRTHELAEGLRDGDVSDYVERYGSSYAPTGG